MFKLNRMLITKIAISALVILSLVNCTKDQNSFLPYTRVNLYIPLANYNHLTIPGNSVLFQRQGFRGIIVICVDPGSNLYYAFDACCPYEKDYSGVVTVQQIKNLATRPDMVFSSDFFGICNKCGSEFNLMGSGQPVKGPAVHYLQRYNISTSFGSLTVTN
jgi:hypothetical protein